MAVDFSGDSTFQEITSEMYSAVDLLLTQYSRACQALKIPVEITL
jgi:hypothetical protein